MMSILRRAVVAALLAVWVFPAAASARTNDVTEAESPFIQHSTSAGSSAGATAPAPATSPSQTYSQREQQSQGLQDFRGGYTAIYIGGGAVTVLLLVLLILILV